MPQMATTLRTELDWSQEGAPFGSPTQKPGNQTRVPSFTGFPRPLAGSWITSGAVRTWTSTLMPLWTSSATGSSWTHSTTMPAHHVFSTQKENHELNHPILKSVCLVLYWIYCKFSTCLHLLCTVFLLHQLVLFSETVNLGDMSSKKSILYVPREQTMKHPILKGFQVEVSSC